MKKFVSLSAATLAATIVAPGLTAQADDRDVAAGFGTETQAIDWEAFTSEFGQLGTTISPATGEVCATVRINPDVGGEHFVQFVDYTGASPRSWFQPAIAQNSEWGWRDGSTDGENLLFSWEVGLMVVDPADGSSVLEVLTANNPSVGSGRAVTPIVVGDVTEPTQAGVIRALAFDAAGNAGDGSFWTGNFGSSTFEVDMDGNILTTFANAGEVHYGMGIDPVTGNLILNSQTAPEILDYDKTTGTIIAANGLALVQGIAGGGEMVPGDTFRPFGSGYDFLALAQGTPDTSYGRRYHLDVAGVGLSTNTRLGTDEPDLIQTIDDGLFFDYSDRGQINYTVDTLTVDFDISIARNPGDGAGVGGGNGTIGVTFAQTSPDADIDSSSFLLRELVHLQTNGITVDPASAPPRQFPFVTTNDPAAAVPSVTNVTLPAAPFQDFDECVRLQSLYIDALVDFLPLAMTNQTRFCRGPDPVILTGMYFETFGANSFNSDTSAGFFSLTNETTTPIDALTVTWINPGNTAQFDNFMRFDTDNPNMADIFLFGNNTVTGCEGTYRNNSAVDNGLNFTGTDLVLQDFNPANLGACVTAGVETGYIPTDDGPTAFGAFAGDYLTLRFEFPTGDMVATGGTPAVFEWDADTDNGLGVSGGDMGGMIVTIEFGGGSSSDVHVNDPNVPIRGYTQL